MNLRLIGALALILLYPYGQATACNKVGYSLRAQDPHPSDQKGLTFKATKQKIKSDWLNLVEGDWTGPAMNFLFQHRNTPSPCFEKESAIHDGFC